jgi:hypothetical protein
MNSLLLIPVISTNLLRAVSPLRMVICRRGTPVTSAKNEIKALLALPSTGGAVSFTFNAPCISPTISFLDERGKTLT